VGTKGQKHVELYRSRWNGIGWHKNHNKKIIYIKLKTGISFDCALLLFKAENMFRIQKSRPGFSEDDF
jgi:hypothetical protein